MAGTELAKRPATKDDGQELLVPIVSGLQELIFGTPGLFIDRPGFIAGPEPDTGLARVVQDVTQFNCRIWAASDKSEYSQTVNAGNADLCGPYLDGLGENPDPGEFGPPFEGGQCPGVLYNVDFILEIFPFSDCSTFGPAPAELNGVEGPIRGLSFRTENPTGPLCTPAGNNVYLLHGGTPGETIIGGAGFGVECSIVGITRADGLPDSCGNPPPEIRPPSTVTPVTPIPPNITVNIPGIGPVDVTLTLNPNGEPVVCIEELDVCVTVQPPAGGGGGGGAGAPPGPGEPGDTENTGDGGSAGGEAGDGEELVGVLVQVLDAPGDANRFANNPAQPYRGIGYVRMGFPNRLGTDISGGTVISPQFFHAQQRGLTAWEVSANTGFNLRVTPYYRTSD